MHKTIHEIDFKIDKSDYKFTYQKDLTNYLDNKIEFFNQNTINEIILWKVSRYAFLPEKTIELINSIDPNEKNIDLEFTKKLLKILLKTKGIKLPMASTILRFRNKNIYQIIDQRVYRIIYPNMPLILKSYLSEIVMKEQIELYLNYLVDLKTVSEILSIPFDQSDRILFMADKRINKNVKLKNY